MQLCRVVGCVCWQNPIQFRVLVQFKPTIVGGITLNHSETEMKMYRKMMIGGFFVALCAIVYFCAQADTEVLRAVFRLDVQYSPLAS